MKPLNLDQVQAICFDVDGTLSDTDDQWVATLTGFLKPMLHLLSEKKIQSMARSIIMAIETPGNQVYHLLDHMDLDDDAARLLNWYTKLRVSNRKPIYLLIPGVREMLETLSSRYPMSVVSARDERSTLDFLNQHYLLSYFTSVATAHTCRFTKPFPDPIKWTANKMNVPSQNCLMVGDTVVDIMAGRAAGAQTVGVLCGFGTETELLRSGANLILKNTSDLTQQFFPETNLTNTIRKPQSGKETI